MVIKPVVFGKAKELLMKVCETRGLAPEDCKVKVMADGGQKFLKFCMTIIPEDYTENTEVAKRTTYREGGTAAKLAEGII